MPPPPRPNLTDEYYTALGRFIDQFSRVEAVMHYILWTFSEIRDADIGRAVFSGVRVDAAISLVNRLVTSQSQWRLFRKELEYVFKQLGVINRVRNDLLHYGVESAGAAKIVTSNRILALTRKHLRRTPVSPAILGDMTYDLKKVRHHLLLIMGVPADRRRAWRDGTDLVCASWRYIPPPQSRDQKASRKKLQGQ